MVSPGPYLVPGRPIPKGPGIIMEFLFMVLQRILSAQNKVNSVINPQISSNLIMVGVVALTALGLKK